MGLLISVVLFVNFIEVSDRRSPLNALTDDIANREHKLLEIKKREDELNGKLDKLAFKLECIKKDMEKANQDLAELEKKDQTTK